MIIHKDIKPGIAASALARNITWEPIGFGSHQQIMVD